MGFLKTTGFWRQHLRPVYLNGFGPCVERCFGIEIVSRLLLVPHLLHRVLLSCSCMPMADGVNCCLNTSCLTLKLLSESPSWLTLSLPINPWRIFFFFPTAPAHLHLYSLQFETNWGKNTSGQIAINGIMRRLLMDFDSNQFKSCLNISDGVKLHIVR